MNKHKLTLKIASLARVFLLARLYAFAGRYAWAQQGPILNLSGVTPFVFPWGRPIAFTTFRAAGKFFIDSLNPMKDPRRAMFASEARSQYKAAAMGGDNSNNKIWWQQ